jgi:hypothetical protein
MKSDIEKYYTIKSKSNFTSPKIGEIRSKLIKDNFEKNPLEILSPEQTKNLNKIEKEKTSIKGNRVAALFSSDSFKNSALNKDYYNNNNHYDKITNQKVSGSIDTPKNFVKTFKVIYDNKKVCYQ